MVVAASVPFYAAIRVRRLNRRLFTLTFLLFAFAFCHSLYHLFSYLGMDFLAYVVFYPFGALLLLAFGIYYWRMGV